MICRLLQGFSAAGEQAGASSLTLEHSPDHQRAFYTSWTLTGTQGGLILASLVMIPFVALPDEAKYSWGWRVPFWLSAVVVVVAYFIRRQLHETPQFTEAKDAGTIARMPLMPLLRNHWRDVVRVIFCAFIAAVSTVFANLAIAYGKKVGLPPTITLWLVVVANVVRARHPATVRQARRPDRTQAGVHLRRAVLGGADALLHAVDEQGNHLLTFVLAVATFSFGYAAANAVWPSFYGEMFSTQVRFSGVAIGTQLGFLVAGFAPTIVTALGGVREGGWVVISIFTAVVCLIAAAAALTARETKDVPTVLLGKNPASAAGSGRPLERKDHAMPSIATNSDSASASQAEVSAEIAAIESAYQRAGIEETQPRLDYAPYRSSLLRHPTKDLHHADPEGMELWTPCFGQRDVGAWSRI